MLIQALGMCAVLAIAPYCQCCFLSTVLAHQNVSVDDRFTLFPSGSRAGVLQKLIVQLIVHDDEMLIRTYWNLVMGSPQL